MPSLNEYRADIERLERGDLDNRVGDDPAFCSRVIYREIHAALWQPWARAEANELAERALSLTSREQS